MPIYEYRCEECEERFEKLVRSSAQPCEPVCPKCGSKQVHKALSVFGVRGGSKVGAGASESHSCGPT